MSLPTIHPLGNGTPSQRGPDGECMCNWCRHWYPLLAHIRHQLNEEGCQLLDEYTSHIEQQAEDGDVAQAKLDGNWPGWEAMKDFKPAQ